MTQINLLPWRAQKRKREKKIFIFQLMAWALCTILFILAVGYYISLLVNEEELHAKVLRQELSILDSQSNKINKLKIIREDLINKIFNIQYLQYTRNEVTYLLTRLRKITPSGVYLTQVQRKKNVISLLGYAQSNVDVSLLMRNIEHDNWFQQTLLSEIKREDKNNSQDNEFKFTVVLKSKRQPWSKG